MPQPYLVPVRPTFSRSAHSSGVSGSTSMLCDCPLIVSEIISDPPMAKELRGVVFVSVALSKNVACDHSKEKRDFYAEQGNKLAHPGNRRRFKGLVLEHKTVRDAVAGVFK